MSIEVTTGVAGEGGGTVGDGTGQITRRGLLKFAGGATAALGLGQHVRYVALAQDSPQSGGTLTVGLSSEPDNIDPHVTPYAVSHNVMMNVFDTLVW